MIDLHLIIACVMISAGLSLVGYHIYAGYILIAVAILIVALGMKATWLRW